MVRQSRSRRSFCGMGTFRPLILTGSILILHLNLNPRASQAQLSPGELSQAHSHLDGLKKCSSCHKLGKRNVGPKCLDCHREIAAMRAGGPGLHANEDFANCIDCHNEHHGRDYDLIFWPDGQENFKHDVLGYEMTGAHLKLKCRQCHGVKHVTNPGELRSLNKEFDRTWLGLDRQCLSCHRDPHDGTLTGGPKQTTCTSCHDTNQWRPAAAFNHDTSEFPLTGKHQKVTCTKCHQAKGKPVTVGEIKVAVAIFKPQAHQNCTACHKDPHANTLGPNCTQCHTTDGWLLINGETFDHTKTKYPLTGRHAGVSCAQCHGEGRKKPAYAACQDCHRDAHDSVRLQRPRLMTCENCHSVDGFQPANYTMARHAESPFPLRGAHQATPCFSCHNPLGNQASTSSGAAKSIYAQAADLGPTHQQCTECHRDPHLGQTTKITNAGGQTGCVACHQETTWRTTGFDHASTKFVLQDRHATAACTACHKPTRQAGLVELAFQGAPKNCAGCHDDIHNGQFATRTLPDSPVVDCGGCHVTLDWFAEKFDHETDSRFPLRGGHEKVACQTCHLPRPQDNQRLVHFKPLPTDCRSCHGNAPADQKQAKEGKS